MFEPNDWHKCAGCGNPTHPDYIEHRDGFEFCVDCLDSEDDFPDEPGADYDSSYEDE